MPISSGFSYYRTNFPTRKRVAPPQIISRASKFQGKQRNKNKNGLFSNSKATAGGKLPAQRPTAVVKQPQRSDTFTLPKKRDETKFKVPEVNQPQNGSRRQPTNKPVIINPSPPAERKRTVTMRKNDATRPMLKQRNSMIDRQNLQRKPVRFTKNYNNTYYSSSPASLPVYYQKPAPLADPLPRDNLDKSRRMRITNDDYIVHRRKDSPAYAYNDYHTVSDIPTISYATSLPPISHSTNQTAPTVIIHSRETPHSDPPQVIIHPKETLHYRPPTVIPTVSTIPSYPSSAPIMFLPSSAAPTSTMILPNSTFPSYPHPTSNMILPTTTAPNQPPVHTFFLQPPATSTYLSPPFFYPMPFPHPKPNPPSSAPPPPPPPPPQQTIISQSSSSSVSAPTTVKTENKTEDNNATIVIQPNTTNNNRKNVTIQLKMLDEDNPPAQRVVRVIRDPPYRAADDLYYIESEPKRIIYEQPRRRTAFTRRPRVNEYEYVYANESPSMVRRHPYRSEVVYVDNDRPLEYEEEVVYVDDDDNEIEYIYHDDEPTYHRRNYKQSNYPSSTNIVYK